MVWRRTGRHRGHLLALPFSEDHYARGSLPAIKDTYFLCLVNENSFSLICLQEGGGAGGCYEYIYISWLLGYISSRTCHIAWLCNMLNNTNVMLYTNLHT